MKQKYFYFSFIFLLKGDIAYKTYWCKSNGSLLKDIIKIKNACNIEEIIILTRIEITKKEFEEAQNGCKRKVY